MSVEKALQGVNFVIGTKQTMRFVEQGKAAHVYVARDADQHITLKIVNLCKKTGIQVNWVDTMKQLGKACGIEVGAAMVAVVSE